MALAAAHGDGTMMKVAATAAGAIAKASDARDAASLSAPHWQKNEASPHSALLVM
jgi:hypothetical protein